MSNIQNELLREALQEAQAERQKEEKITVTPEDEEFVREHDHGAYI